MYPQASRGQASILLVLLIGGIISAVIVTLSLVTISAIGAGFGSDQLQRARGAALAGIEDGVIRLTRDPSTSGAYSIFTGVVSTTVTVSQATPSAGFTSITSVATVGFQRSTLLGVYSIDPISGIPTPVSVIAQ